MSTTNRDEEVGLDEAGVEDVSYDPKAPSGGRGIDEDDRCTECGILVEDCECPLNEDGEACVPEDCVVCDKPVGDDGTCGERGYVHFDCMSVEDGLHESCPECGDPINPGDGVSGPNGTVHEGCLDTDDDGMDEDDGHCRRCQNFIAECDCPDEGEGEDDGHCLDCNEFLCDCTC